MLTTRDPDVRRPLTADASIVTPSRIVVWLTVLLAVVAAIAAGVGLLSAGGPGPHEVVSARGQAVGVYGTGLYRHDSWLVGVGNRGTDAVTLYLELPALVIALVAYRHRSVRGAVALVGVLGWLLYYYASMSLYTAYNPLFGLYVLALALAVWAAPLALRSIDPAGFAAVFPSRPSRRLLLGYLACLAALLVLAWVPSLLAAALSGGPPSRLGLYSTEVTWALDLGIVVPAVAATWVLLHRGATYGAVAATAMLALNVALGAALAGQGIAQLVGDVPVSTGEVVGPMASFALLTIVAASLLLPLLAGLPPNGGPADVQAPARSVEIHLEELGQHSGLKALAGTMTGFYGMAQFRFVARRCGAPDQARHHVATGATFPVMRFADLDNEVEPNAWLDTARERLGELDRELARDGWHRRPGRGPHWWSLTYDRS